METTTVQLGAMETVLLANSLKVCKEHDTSLFRWKKKYFFLLSDGSLQYHDEKPLKSLKRVAGSNLSVSALPIGIIPVKSCSVSLEGDIFMIKDNETYETFLCKAKSEEEAKEWVKHLTILSEPNSSATSNARKRPNPQLVIGRCSWCFKLCQHGRVSTVTLLRGTHSCISCSEFTVPCKDPSCKDFARGHKYVDDDYCLVHSNVIDKWEDASISSTDKHGWCTWCCTDTIHRFVAKNKLSRDRLRCKECNHRTVACKTRNCDSGMARANAFKSDNLCGLCDPKRAGGHEKIEEANELNSFAVEHTNVNATFLIDAKETFLEMAKAIENAKVDIYMSFWLMCCVIRVRRTHPKTDDDRLDEILLRKAREGVHINVLLWNEPPLLVNNFSKENKQFLEELSPKIKVVRHPTFLPVIFSHHQKFVVVDQEIAFVGGIDLAWGRYDWHEHLIIDPEGFHWWGVDYYNPHIKPPGEFYDIQNPEKTEFDREKVTRMPWHDVDIRVDGNTARDVAKNFIQRWNHHKDINEPSLVLRNEMISDQKNSGSSTCQVLRSLGDWSGSPNGKEDSIYRAYSKAIAESEHYIYIENQFFVSCYAGAGVTNQIVHSIFLRIKRAIEEKAPFSCIIIFPQPEEVGRWAIPTLQRQLRTATALVERLSLKFPSVTLSDYLMFYQLRVHAYLNDVPVTDQIFVHSKLMIIDDRVAIVGSNNINDRSFAGDRDSELAIMTTDAAKMTIPLHGEEHSYEVGKCVHQLRMKLWNEHLGFDLDDKRVEDPFVGHALFYEFAIKNTEIYEEVFGSIPSNRLRDWEQFMDAREKNTISPSHKELLPEVRGFAMIHPLHFMAEEKATIREGIMSVDLFQ